jgi:hypothetical protein
MSKSMNTQLTIEQALAKALINLVAEYANVSKEDGPAWKEAIAILDKYNLLPFKS